MRARALLWAWMLLGTSQAAESDLDALRWRRQDAEWRSPTVFERDWMRDVARELVSGRDACTDRGLRRAQRAVDELGFVMETVSIGDSSVVVVREGEQAFGAGMLAVRCGPAEPIVWQAPHPFFDLGTGDLVLQWFVETDARAAQWATHHRFKARSDEVREDSMHPADVADEPGSLFQAATVGFFEGDPGLRFVQVHGFANGTAPGYRAVVSSGDARRPLRDAARRAQTVLGRTAVFGDVDLPLGGQQNAQARALPVGVFMHLELSADAREDLSTDARLRRRVARTLGDGPW